MTETIVKTLAIETSCDDTSIAIVNFDGKIFHVDTMSAYSQVADHREWGGVVPEIASRLHSEKILSVLHKIGVDKIPDLDCISVTTHPGLPGSLLVGKCVGSLLAEYFDKPLIRVDHIMGHVFSLFLERSVDDVVLPLLVLSVSGSHNDLYLVERDKGQRVNGKGQQRLAPAESVGAKDCGARTDEGKGEEGELGGVVKNKSDTFERTMVGDFVIKKLGKKLDDASGEAFDKVARMLGGPYPGGPWIASQAELRHDDTMIKLGKPLKYVGGYDFSFSGLKSQVYRHVHQENFEQKDIPLVAHTFQEIVVDILSYKLLKVAEDFAISHLGIVGGVSANKRLREKVLELAGKDKETLRPVKMSYCTDNAAMIGVVGILQFI